MAASVHFIGRGTAASGSTVATTNTNASVGGSGTVGFLVLSFDPGVTVSGTITDSKGNVLALLGTTANDASEGKLAVYYKENWTGGSGHTSGTVSFSGTCFAVAHLVEVRGVAASGAIDKDSSEVDTAQPCSIQSGTLAQAAEAVLIICAANEIGGTTNGYAFSPGTLLSEEADVNQFWTSGIAYAITSATTDTAYTGRRNSPTTTGGGHIRLISLKEAAGGTTYNQSASGSCTATGALVKQTGKATAGSITSTGALVRQAAKALVGSLTGTGALNKSTTKSFAGSITAAGSLLAATVLHITLTGSITAAGALSRMTLKAVAGALTAVGNLATALQAVLPHGKAVHFVGDGGSSITTDSFNSSDPCAVVVAIGRGDIGDHSAPTDNKSGSYSQIGTAHAYTDWPTSGIAVYGAVSEAGGAGHTVTASKPDVNDEVTILAVAVPNGTGILGHTWTEDLTDPNTGSITVAGPCTLISFWGGDDPSGELNPAVDSNWRKLDWTSSLASNHVQMASAYREVVSAGTYTVTWTPSTSQGAQVWIVAVAAGTAYTKALAGIITMVGSLQRSVNMLQGIAGTVTPSGVLRKLTQRTLAGSLTPQGALSRMTAKLVSGSLTPSGGLSRFTSRTLRGTITAAGALARGWQTAKSLAGSITMTGALASVLNPVFEAGRYWLGKLVLNSRRRRKR